MAQFRMIADDLTGANANCSLMKKIGLNAATLLDVEAKIPEKFEAFAITTDSRGIESKEAYEKVIKALTNAKSEKAELYSKRVDSTLRGNLGAEINAFFHVLGEDYMGIAVPAYPDTNRIVINGTMLVNGQLLLNSDAGRDTKTPVFTSEVIELFRKDLNYKSEIIYLEEIEKGKEYLSKLILEKKNDGVKLLIFDGVINEHLELIAKAVLDTKIKFFSVDPGPFTSEIANQILDREDKLNKVLMVVGSVTDITISQIHELLNSNDNISVVKVDAKKLAIESKRSEEINRVSEKALQLLKDDDFILITSTPIDIGEKRLNLSDIAKTENKHIDDISVMISSGLAEIAKNIVLSDYSFAGTYMSGGDITVALTKLLGAEGLEIREEVIPLAAYGRIMGGLKPDMRVISKGGMVGNKDAMKICVEKLTQVTTD